jgi:hypothetical protein
VETVETMEEDEEFARTSLLTSLRMAADTLLIPVWPSLGAPVAKREIMPDGIRYHLMLPRLDLELVIRARDTVVPSARLTLGARPRAVGHRLTAAILHPFTSGFDEIDSTVLSDGSMSSLERVLLELRAVLWDHPSYGRDAIGLRQVA